MVSISSHSDNVCTGYYVPRAGTGTAAQDAPGGTRRLAS